MYLSGSPPSGFRQSGSAIPKPRSTSGISSELKRELSAYNERVTSHLPGLIYLGKTAHTNVH